MKKSPLEEACLNARLFAFTFPGRVELFNAPRYGIDYTEMPLDLEEFHRTAKPVFVGTRTEAIAFAKEHRKKITAVAC